MENIRENENVAMSSRLDRLLWFLLVRISLILLWLGLCVVIGVSILIIGSRDVAHPASHGETLSDFMIGASEEEYEYVALFTPTGKKIIELTSDSPTSTAIPYVYVWCAEIAGQEIVHIHNHPNHQETGYPEIDAWKAAPSVTDLLSCLVIKPAQSLVVSGQYVSCLEAPLGWPDEDEFRDYLREMEELAINQDWPICHGLDSEFIELCCYPYLFECMVDHFNLTYEITTIEEWLQNQQMN